VILYIAVPELRVGPLTISAYGVLAFLSIVAGQWISFRRSVGSGLDAETSGRLVVGCAGAGLIGSHLWWMAAHGSNDLFSLRGMVSFGGFLGISAGIALMILWHPLASVLKWFDAAGYALVFGQTIGRAGCALQHDHLGIPSGSFFAVAFPGGPRFDLGLVELTFVLPLSVAVWFAGRRVWPPGGLFGVIFIVYGAFRLWLDTLRAEHAMILGVSEDVLGGSLMVAMGLGALWLCRRGLRHERDLRAQAT
jgi:phosphatidylglycerol:prolipoprotein diacylglycerol transferase